QIVRSRRNYRPRWRKLPRYGQGGRAGSGERPDYRRHDWCRQSNRPKASTHPDSHNRRHWLGSDVGFRLDQCQTGKAGCLRAATASRHCAAGRSAYTRHASQDHGSDRTRCHGPRHRGFDEQDSQEFDFRRSGRQGPFAPGAKLAARPRHPIGSSRTRSNVAGRNPCRHGIHQRQRGFDPCT
ncbi:hypothetical protein OY671_010238, partial [Metschnikowia pulcherrima]